MSSSHRKFGVKEVIEIEDSDDGVSDVAPPRKKVAIVARGKPAASTAGMKKVVTKDRLKKMVTPVKTNTTKDMPRRHAGKADDTALVNKQERRADGDAATDAAVASTDVGRYADGTVKIDTGLLVDGYIATPAAKDGARDPLASAAYRSQRSALGNQPGSDIVATLPLSRVGLRRADVAGLLELGGAEDDAVQDNNDSDDDDEGKGTSSQGWLDDKCIDFLLETLVVEVRRRMGLRQYWNDSICVLASRFTASLMDKKAKVTDKAVREVIKDAYSGPPTLENLHMMFVPWIRDEHWILIVVFGRARKILLLDSFGRGGKSVMTAANKRAAERVIHRLLRVVMADSYIRAEWGFVNGLGEEARQMDSDNCGVFVCADALALAKGGSSMEDLLASESVADARQILSMVVAHGGFTNDLGGPWPEYKPLGMSDVNLVE